MKPSAVAARFLRPAAAMSAAGLLAAALAPVTATAAASRLATAPAPVLSWRPCDGGFQCATARVPLDYRHPRGATISIAVIRHRATAALAAAAVLVSWSAADAARFTNRSPARPAFTVK